MQCCPKRLIEKKHFRNARIRSLLGLIINSLAVLGLFAWLIGAWWTKTDRSLSGATLAIFVVGGLLCLLVLNVVSDVLYELYHPDDQNDEEHNIPCSKDCSMGTPWFIKWLIRKSTTTIKRYRATSKPVHCPDSVV